MKRYLLFCFVVVLFSPGVLYATHIAMVARMEIDHAEDWIDVKVTITNMGDEDALTVFPELKTGRAEVKLDPVASLCPNESHQWTYRFETERLGFDLRGSYPLFLTTHYHDASMYPFSMPEIHLLYHNIGPFYPPVEGTFEVGKMKLTGRATVTLTNNSPYEISGTADLFLPDELVSLTPKIQFHLSRDQESRIPFEIKNSGAIKGSGYRVYAVIRTIQHGIHSALVIPEIIEVTSCMDSSKAFTRIVGGIIFLAILFVITIYFEMKKVTE